MRRNAKAFLLGLLAGVLAVLAAVGGGLAIHLVRLGAFPPAGEGSLGHVGAILAGGIAGFLGLVLGLLALWAGRRARASARSSGDPHPTGPALR